MKAAICVHASVDSVVDEPTQRERRISKPVDRFSPIEEAKPSRKRKIGRNLQQPTLKEKKMPALKRGDNPVGVVLSYCATFNVLDVIVSFASLKVRYLEKAQKPPPLPGPQGSTYSGQIPGRQNPAPQPGDG